MISLKRHVDDACPAARALAVIGDEWTLLTVRELFRRPSGYAEVKRALDISDHTLSRRLDRLFKDGIIEWADDGPRSPYRLTAAGQALGPVLIELGLWGRTWRPVADDAKLPEQLQVLMFERSCVDTTRCQLQSGV
jgi:DNA-binding HxlR family transcriptional regulator